jgi:menaquinol-cytochrome c reductase iron-sulfur subunit
VVFSRNCTDASCPVVFDAGSDCFLCPCHGGVFSKDGTPLHGPPPRPLWRYAARVRAGVLEIDLNSLPPMT